MRAMYLPDHLLHWQDTKCNAKRQNKKTQHAAISVFWTSPLTLKTTQKNRVLTFQIILAISVFWTTSPLTRHSMTHPLRTWPLKQFHWCLSFSFPIFHEPWKTALMHIAFETISLIFSCSWQSMVNLFPQLAQEVHMVLRGQNLYSCPRVVALIWPGKEYFLYVEKKVCREMSSCYMY